MNETEQIIDGLDEVEITNTSIDEIDSENINLIFVGIDKSGSMGMKEFLYTDSIIEDALEERYGEE